MLCGNLLTVRIFNVLAGGVLCFAFLFTSRTIILAQASPEPSVMEVAYEKTNANSGFGYVTKRLGEKVKLFFLSFSAEGKESYYTELAGRRLAELKYVIEKEDKNNFEIATIRYSSTVGEWIEFILDEKLDERKEPAAGILTKHLPVVEKLMTKYDGTTAEWRFVKQDFDYLNIYISKLQN